MPPGKSGSRDRAETRAAKESERAGMAEQLWNEVEVQKVIADEKTARLKEQRLARTPRDPVSGSVPAGALSRG